MHLATYFDSCRYTEWHYLHCDVQDSDRIQGWVVIKDKRQWESNQACKQHLSVNAALGYGSYSADMHMRHNDLCPQTYREPLMYQLRNNDDLWLAATGLLGRNQEDSKPCPNQWISKERKTLQIQTN